MAWHLTPMAPSDACAKWFVSARNRAVEQAARDGLGDLQHEQVSIDGRTVIFTFASGATREVTMPRPEEVR
jgi:hypothetical protein